MVFWVQRRAALSNRSKNALGFRPMLGRREICLIVFDYQQI